MAPALDPPERQVSAKRATFRRKSQRHQGFLDSFLQLQERLGGPLEPHPHHAHLFDRWKGPAAQRLQPKRCRGDGNPPKQPLDFTHLVVGDVTQELQGEVDAFGFDPGNRGRSLLPFLLELG